MAFALFKDLNMMAVSTGEAVHLFDYESDLTHLAKIEAAGVSYICFVDVFIVLQSQSADEEQCLLTCYQIDSPEPEGSIAIKQFLGAQCRVRPSDSSVVFACGSQLGRVSVPEMELQYQEDSGHKGGILDFSVSHTSIFST